jgi:hypothetical protein
MTKRRGPRDDTESPEAAESYTMTLTRREARRLDRMTRRSSHRRPAKTTIMGQMMAFWDNAAEARKVANLRPGRRGWRVRAAGRVNLVDALVEYQGTTVQVEGLWPFVLGSGSPVVGVPLGPHLLNQSTVCADPIFWFLNNLVLNPSAFVIGRPGLGKSTVVRRMVTVLEAWGIVPMVLGDTKPDYADLIEAMEGQIIALGRGRKSVNPLDLGPLMEELSKLPEEGNLRRRALEEMRGRRLNLFTGLLALIGDRPLEPFEKSIISECLRMLDPDLTTPPLVGDVLDLVNARDPRIAALALDRNDKEHYFKRVEGLLDLLTALGENGPFGDVFSRPTSEHVEMGRPLNFDLSSIDDSDSQLLAAAQSVCWNYGSAVVSAEKHLAEAGLREQRHYFLVMDELWRMLRASSTMVFFVDALTRLNRQRGIGQIMATHTMNDLKLSTQELSDIASGFVERSAMVFMGGLAEAEMGNLTRVFAMSGSERNMIMDWSSEGAVNPETGKAAAPPGRGKFIMKIGKKPGVPFRLQLTPTELAVNDTNKAWKAASARAANSSTHQLDSEHEWEDA